MTISSSDDYATATIMLPGAAYSWVSTTGNKKHTKYFCNARIINGPANVLGNLFMANYVTTLNYESQEITFQANANAPDGVGVSCPEGLCNDPSPPGSGLSVGAIIGIVIGGLILILIIIAVIYWYMQKNRNDTPGDSDKTFDTLNDSKNKSLYESTLQNVDDDDSDDDGSGKRG